MAHLLARQSLVRANVVLLLGLVWGGLAVCALAAALYDITRWFNTW